jgi:hypothetical protein
MQIMIPYEGDSVHGLSSIHSLLFHYCLNLQELYNKIIIIYTQKLLNQTFISLSLALFHSSHYMFQVVFTNYTSILNVTYLFSPSPSHFHNMFHLYIAMIRCSFAKNCFTVWYISLLLQMF